MQNDFESVGGMFDRAGIDVSSIQAKVPRSVLAAARDAGLIVCSLKMGFVDDLGDAGYPHSPTWIKHLALNVGAPVVSPVGEPSRFLIRDTCVESTVIDAMARDFHCLVVEDCVVEPIGADLERSNHDASLLTLQLLFASITDSDAVIAALTQQPTRSCDPL